MRDFIFKGQLNDAGYVDHTWAKKSVAGLLGDRVVDGKAAYLFSSEPLIDHQSGWFRLRVMNDNIPTDMKEIPVPAHDPGSRVLLHAWVALKGNNLKADEPRAILTAKCRHKLVENVKEHFGGVLGDLEVQTDPGIEVATAVTKGVKIHRPFGRVSISGVVENSAALIEIQKNGIGSAKAYGFGLVVSSIIKE